jgi:hypothetical protein
MQEHSFFDQSTGSSRISWFCDPQDGEHWPSIHCPIFQQSCPDARDTLDGVRKHPFFHQAAGSSRISWFCNPQDGEHWPSIA